MPQIDNSHKTSTLPPIRHEQNVPLSPKRHAFKTSRSTSLKSSKRLVPRIEITSSDITTPSTSSHHRAAKLRLSSSSRVSISLPDNVSTWLESGTERYEPNKYFIGSKNRYLRKMSLENSLPRCSNNVSPAAIRQYLNANPNFLDEYVRKNISSEQLERWLLKKAQNCQKDSRSIVHTEIARRKPSLSKWKLYVHSDKKKMLQEMTHGLFTRSNPVHVILELASCISSAIEADGFTLYLMDRSSGFLSTYLNNEDRIPHDLTYHDSENKLLAQKGMTFAEYVARYRNVVRTSIIKKNPLYPGGIATDRVHASAVLCHPLIQPDGEVIGALELYKRDLDAKFDEEDEEISDSYLVWGGIALHYAELYSKMMKQETQNSFILNVVKSIFQDMVTMDTVIKKIMNFAQKLVDADRASLFLVDHKTRELYARIFDMGGQHDSKLSDSLKSEKEIRFPIGKGIAGHVALTGKSLNIADAYHDDRFNRTVDLQTGYQTKNILCMPIFNHGRVIGVVQMVNKLDGSFTRMDEEAFSTFAIYCGLALHHAKLYDKIRRSEQKYKVAWEILSYHALSSQDDVKAVKHVELSTDKCTSLQKFSLSPYGLNSEETVQSTIFMFKDLFGLQNFDYESLLKFTLTVKKNYRRVPYHNWTHGFSVANSMYSILKRTNEKFKPLEELSLFVACLCHDLDHRGVNNQFLIKTSSPLASIYTTSPLENHHFNHTVSILQQEGHNIFRNFTSDEFKEVLRNIKHCILATDLALFFPNKAKLQKIVDENQFDYNNLEHRLLLQALSMTACDLIASSKPWDQQVQTVKVIFQEFYEQGDAERAQGSEPIPMMDRNKVRQQPTSQIGFLKGICLPCYELLVKLIPQTEPLLQGCQKNLARWQAIEEEQNSKETEDGVEV